MRALLLSCVALSLCPASTSLAETTTVHKLSPVVGPGSNVTNDIFAAWTSHSAAILQNSDSDGDSPCTDVSLSTSALKTDASVTNVVLTQSQKASLSRVKSGNVVIVDDLRYCGRMYPTSVAGCESGHGPIILVNTKNAGLSLVHELGHRFSLPHTWDGMVTERKPDGTTRRVRSCPTPPPDSAGIQLKLYHNIMYCRGHLKRTWVTSIQCNLFRTKNVFSLPFSEVGTPPFLVEALPLTPLEIATGELEIFLLDGFLYGTPFDAIASLSPAQLEAIRALLRTHDASDVVSNAAIVIGLRGDNADLELLTALLQSQSGEDSPEALRVRTSAVLAIGFLAARLADEVEDAALAFLLRMLPATQAEALSSEKAAPALASSIALAVAYSGNPAAAKGMIDLVAASGHLSGGGSQGTQAYIQSLPTVSKLASLPNFYPMDAGFAEQLARTSIAVSQGGLDSVLQGPAGLGTPVAADNPIAELANVVQRSAGSDLGPRAEQVLRDQGLDAVWTPLSNGATP